MPKYSTKNYYCEEEEKSKIIHENDAIQSENSPMLFIQKIILSQE